MLTNLNTCGFKLFEILFPNTIVGIKTCLLFVSLPFLLDSFMSLNTTLQFKGTLRLANLLALNKRKFHRLKSEYRKLPLQRKNSVSYKTVLQEKVSGKSQLMPPTVLNSALSALPLEAPSFSKLRITAQKPWSVRLYVSDRLKF